MTAQITYYFPMAYSQELHNAILANDMPRIERALERVSELNAQYYGSKSTPLRHAILQCNPYIVDMLLSRGACPNHKLEDGLTAFHYAVRMYGPSIRSNNLTMKLRVLLRLLRSNAYIHTKDPQGKTAREELEEANYMIEGIYLKEYIPLEQSAKACALAVPLEQSAKACSLSARPSTPLPTPLGEDLYT
jgi:hypothetical protein